MLRAEHRTCLVSLAQHRQAVALAQAIATLRQSTDLQERLWAAARLQEAGLLPPAGAPYWRSCAPQKPRSAVIDLAAFRSRKARHSVA